MVLSRRKFLHTLGFGAAASAATPWPIPDFSLAAIFDPRRPEEPGNFIRLNSNENAYGPSEKVALVLRSALSMANRYPYMEYETLVERIAGFHGVKSEQVILGCGSTEVLRIAASTFLGRGKQLVQPLPTFEAIEDYARCAGAEVFSVPLNRQFAHDLEGMLTYTSATLVYICNPNNPTGSITPRKDLETFISKLPATTYVLIDEAYHHYAGQSAMYASFIEHPLDDERVIVCRSFSGVYGLAGLRLGYGIAAAKTIQRMRPYSIQNNVNAVVARAALVALEDDESVREFVRRNTDDRQEFFNDAMARMLHPIDSHANFVMMNIHRPAEEAIAHFRKNNILIGRHFPPMDTYIRVSLGTPDEMRAFWRIWDSLSYPKMPMQH